MEGGVGGGGGAEVLCGPYTKYGDTESEVPVASQVPEICVGWLSGSEALQRQN